MNIIRYLSSKEKLNSLLDWLNIHEFYLNLHHIQCKLDNKEYNGCARHGFRDYIMTNILSDKANIIVLQEKWIVFVKKHPFVYFFMILLFCILPLALVIVTPSSNYDKGGVIILMVSLLFFLLLNVRVIRRMVAPKRFEVSLEDDRLLIKKNEEEVLNVMGKDVSFFKLIYYMKVLKAFRIDYNNLNGQVKRFILSLDFVPNEDCEALLQILALFYSKNVDSKKLTDGENWGTNLLISIVFLISLLVLGCMSDDGISGKILFAIIINICFFILSLYKYLALKNNKNKE